MKIGIISDIHSNIQALSKVFDWFDDRGIDRIICLGDVVGYGADPNPCCDLIRDRCEVTLLGNHDAAVIGNMDISWYYQEARDAILWTRAELSEANFDWLYGLPYTYQDADAHAGFYHAAPLKPSGFYYLVQTQAALAHTQVYEQLDTWNFVGHSHLLNQYMIDDTRAKDLTGHVLEARDGRKFLINVGSVGQPRDRDSRLCFGVLDAEAQRFEHVRLEYDIQGAADKITEVGLDDKFAQRLFAGR